MGAISNLSKSDSLCVSLRMAFKMAFAPLVALALVGARGESECSAGECDSEENTLLALRQNVSLHDDMSSDTRRRLPPRALQEPRWNSIQLRRRRHVLRCCLCGYGRSLLQEREGGPLPVPGWRRVLRQRVRSTRQQVLQACWPEERMVPREQSPRVQGGVDAVHEWARRQLPVRRERQLLRRCLCVPR